MLCHRAARSSLPRPFPLCGHWGTVGLLAGTHQCALRCPGRVASGTKRQLCACSCASVASSWHAHSTIWNCGVVTKGADVQEMSAFFFLIFFIFSIFLHFHNFFIFLSFIHVFHFLSFFIFLIFFIFSSCFYIFLDFFFKVSFFFLSFIFHYCFFIFPFFHVFSSFFFFLLSFSSGPSIVQMFLL